MNGSTVNNGSLSGAPDTGNTPTIPGAVVVPGSTGTAVTPGTPGTPGTNGTSGSSGSNGVTGVGAGNAGNGLTTPSGVPSSSGILQR
ncbi:MAG TPA: hypothetical protein VIF82_00790 [Burkholderiaceae bacterium]|jgi:hypothetical protein